MAEFRYAPSHYVPFRDVEAIARCRAIKRGDIEKHKNPDLKIRVVKDVDVPFINLTDFVSRVQRSLD
jgi:glucosamine-6-phosphate deaminase